MKEVHGDTKELDESSLLGRVSLDDEDAAVTLTLLLDDALSGMMQRDILIVCVGTDRSTGDAFGPIVGSRLFTLPRLAGVDVLGTLDEPVHAVNLVASLDHIAQRYPEPPFIIAVDACLGKFDHVGQITLERGPLRPGAGVKKSLPAFGDLTLTGIVNVSGFMEYFVLQNTRLSIVMKMADLVVQSLRASLGKVAVTRELTAEFRA